ncbi:MAG: TolC family protein [Cyanobacteriota bacterium]
MVRFSSRVARFSCLVALLTAIANGGAKAEGWQKAPPLPTDMRDLLSSISEDSNLYRLYRLYRENRDGLQKAATRISLDQAIAMGISSSPLLAANVDEIQASQWSRIAVTREWIPSLSVKTSDPGVLGFTTTTSSLKTKTDGNEPSEKLTFKHGFSSTPYASLSWAFLDPSRGARLNAVTAQNNSLRNKFTFTSRELILAIQTAYCTLQEALDREKDNIELFNQAIHIYIEASKAQKPAGEISRFEAQAVSLLIARIKAHKISIQAANSLASLINLEPGKLALPSSSPELVSPWPLSRAESIDLALAQREELQANAWDVKALMSAAQAIRNKALPSVSLASQLKRISANQQTGNLTGNVSGQLSRSSGYESFFGFTFDWKVFDGGIRAAESNAIRAKAEQSMEQGQLSRLTITRQVADAYATFVASKILVDAARSDVGASRKSLQAALDEYNRGRGDAGTTVVQALSKLQSALDSYRTLVTEQNLAIYQLNRYSATWPGQTQTLVDSQYQRWLPTALASPTPAATLKPKTEQRAPDSPALPPGS